MRSAPTPADRFPLGVGGTFHENQGRFSSPRASGASIDTGDTLSSSASLGDGSSSPPPLGQLTPGSLPPQEDEILEVGAGVAIEDPATGASDDAAALHQSPPAITASPSGDGRGNQDRKNTPRQKANGNRSSLVGVRGSPSGQSEARTTPFSVVGGQGQQKVPPPLPHSPASPIGARSSVRVTRGVAAGVAAGAAASRKRKRPAAAGASQRSVTTRYQLSCSEDMMHVDIFTTSRVFNLCCIPR